MSDFSVAEIGVALADLDKSLGGDRKPNLIIFSADTTVSVSYYAEGGYSGHRRCPKGNTFREAIENARVEIAALAVTRREKTIRTMALAIIDITDQHVTCTEALLRGHKFSGQQIADHHEAACVRASEMSGNAPFRVVMAAQKEPAQ